MLKLTAREIIILAGLIAFLATLLLLPIPQEEVEEPVEVLEQIDNRTYVVVVRNVVVDLGEECSNYREALALIKQKFGNVSVDFAGFLTRKVWEGYLEGDAIAIVRFR